MCPFCVSRCREGVGRIPKASPWGSLAEYLLYPHERRAVGSSLIPAAVSAFVSGSCN